MDPRIRQLILSDTNTNTNNVGHLSWNAKLLALYHVKYDTFPKTNEIKKMLPDYDRKYDKIKVNEVNDVLMYSKTEGSRFAKEYSVSSKQGIYLLYFK